MSLADHFCTDEVAGVFAYRADALSFLRTLPDAFVHTVITDPPYGLGDAKPDVVAAAITAWATGDRERVPDGRGFMGRRWDAFVPPPAVWDECLRVLKPGGWLACFAGSRTTDLMGLSIRLAGFEMRDSISAWLYGSGFPKSRNVSADLDRLPRCRCAVGSEVANDGVGREGAVAPAGPVRAGVGAEPAAALGDLGTADLARGPRGEPGRDATNGSPAVQGGVEDAIGDRAPVVLGTSGVAGPAQRQQVVGRVGSVEVEPEPLRDQVVGDEPVDRHTVGAGAVTSDAVGGDVDPSTTAVLPLAAAPGRVSGSGVAVPVVDGHAGARAVDGGVGPAPELTSADPADVDAIALRSTTHVAQSTAEHGGLSRCTDCSGVRGVIPRGIGTALKPAHEPILVARRPLSGTVAANTLAHGCGGLNVDACRVETDDVLSFGARTIGTTGVYGAQTPKGEGEQNPDGRWPTNVVLAHAPELDPVTGEVVGDACADPERGCAPECHVRQLDEGTADLQGAVTVRRNLRGQEQNAHGIYGSRTRGASEDVSYGDSGGASRFYPTFRYTAKAGRRERPQAWGAHPDCACEPSRPLDPETGALPPWHRRGTVCATCERPATYRGHPTVKPLGLIEWLVALLTPTEAQLGDGRTGTVLDPFAGSGSLGQAARTVGVRAVLVERDVHSARLIAARLGVDEPDRDPTVPLLPARERPAVVELVPEPVPTAAELLLADAHAAGSKAELMTLYRRAVAEELWTDDVRAVFTARRLEIEGVAA